MNLNISKSNPVESLTSAVRKLHTFFGVSVFFTWTVGINDKDSSQHIVKIDQAKLTIDNVNKYTTDDEEERETVDTALLDYMVEVSRLAKEKKELGEDEVQMLREVIELEKELAKLMLRPSVHRQETGPDRLVTK